MIAAENNPDTILSRVRGVSQIGPDGGRASVHGTKIPLTDTSQVWTSRSPGMEGFYSFAMPAGRKRHRKLCRFLA